jgi:hypothetical protein
MLTYCKTGLSKASLSLAFLATFAIATLAGAQPALPDTGVDVPAFISLAVTLLGSIVAVAIAAYFAFRVIKWGVRWANLSKG